MKMSIAGMLFLLLLSGLLAAVLLWAGHDIKKFNGKKKADKGKVWYCKACGHTGSRNTVYPGSTLINLILCFLYIVPGIIYALWRLSAKYYVCPECNQKDLIPADSPLAKKFSA